MKLLTPFFLYFQTTEREPEQFLSMMKVTQERDRDAKFLTPGRRASDERGRLVPSAKTQQTHIQL